MCRAGPIPRCRIRRFVCRRLARHGGVEGGYRCAGLGGVASSSLSVLDAERQWALSRPRSRVESRNPRGQDQAGGEADRPLAGAHVADSLGAEAFTVGCDIYLGKQTSGLGKRHFNRLLGHELAHVVQKARTGLALQPKLKITGTAANLARVAALLNRGLFGRRVDIDKATGNVTIASTGIAGPATATQQALADHLA